jgi:tetratricopeptide (TPR) repeat protein
MSTKEFKFVSLELLKKFQNIVVLAPLLILVMMMVGCAHLTQSDERLLRNSAIYNIDRAPQSLEPKLSEEQVNRQEADAHFTLAESYAFQGESAKAIEEFKQTLLKDPASVTVRLKLAAEYVRSGLITEAIEAADSAVKLAPKNPEARMLLAGLYTGVKLFDQAIVQFEEAYAMDPSNEEAALFIGAVQAEKGEFVKAENHFDRVLKIPDFKSKAKAHYYLGKINHEKEDADVRVTLKHLRRAIQENPDYRDAVIALAQVLSEEEMDQEAEKALFKYQEVQGPDPEMTRLLTKIYLKNKDFEKAAEQMAVLSKFDSSNMSLKIQRALIHMELKESDQAIALLEEILEEAPDLDKARFYLGALYLDKQQFSRAISNFEQIPAASTYYSDARVQIAQLYKEANRFPKAEATLVEAIKSRDDLPELVAALATTYDSQRKYKEAQKILEAGVQKFPEDTQLNFFLGSVFDRLGETEKSIEMFKVTLEIDPDHVQALNYLAYTYAETGKNLEEAEEFAQKALRLSPNDPYIMDTVGWIKFKMGNYKAAQKLIEAAYRQKPDEAVIAEHLGDIYSKTESWSRAAAMYHQAQLLESDTKKADQIREKLAAIQNQAQPANRLPASLPE